MITYKKGPRVEAPQGLKDKGVVAFQVVDFSIVIGGTIHVESTHDTRILEDGRQYVIGGDGYIEHGYELLPSNIT